MQNIFKNKAIYVIALVAAIVALKLVWSGYEYRYVAATKQDYTLYVPTNASLAQIEDSLKTALRKPKKFSKHAKNESLNEINKPGKYFFPKGVSYAYIIRHIQGGMQTPVKLTFNNVRSLDVLAGKIATKIEADSASLATYFLADSTALKHGFNKENFIAMFIPNTYEIYWNTDPEGFTNRMQREYKNFWNEQRRGKAKELGMNELEVSTLASIVFEETKMSDEMPRVAGVYINRLKIGMPLQADPTLKFALGDYSLRRILYKHMEIDSPYNTYKYKGLPPAPICMPSIKAVDAVLNYEQHKYLYFCANADFSGYHSFAKTLKEHNKNAKAYSNALNKAKIYK